MNWLLYGQQRNMNKKLEEVTSATDSTRTDSERKRNQSLTDEEKNEKKKLKKGIKVQAKLKTLRTRIKHSIRRKDPDVEAKARKELVELVEKEEILLKELGLYYETVSTHENDTGITSEVLATTEIARNMILDISNQLFRSQEAQKSLDLNGRQSQVDDSVKLLRHMTKGTQDLSMFHNQSCWGYCRQKFYERALLLCKSLHRLTVSQEYLDSLLQYKTQIEKSEIMLQQNERQDMYFQAKSIGRVFSLGCGPGNDAVGLITFLRMIHGKKFEQVGHVILLDWSIKEWRDSVLQPLKHILHEQKFVHRISTEYCDVTKDMVDLSNQKLKNLILLPSSKENGVDIFLISYLLSETRDKWSTFFQELVHISKPGSLFYFAEPIPWQLHRLIDMFHGTLTFAWVDSSRDNPSLQKLDGRTGPAVLFAKKKIK